MTGFPARDPDEQPRIQRVSARYRPPPPDDEEPPEPVRVPRRVAGSDPTLGLLVGFALSLGLTALLPENADLRYTLVSAVLALFAAFAYVLGSMDRIGRDSLQNLAWGVGFGLLVGIPVLLVGGATLGAMVRQLFRTGIDGVVTPMSEGVVLAYLIFVMPTAETLMFRGLLQTGRPFWIPGLIGSLWSALLFLPMIDISRFPIVALMLLILVALFNMSYAYVRQRNGLAAAWVAQVLVYLIVFFLPYTMR
ncbi:MAG TPA: hypothetical protein VER79_04070 [Candidatus Limnocylindrales bacterium]|nr:hypothetical protein [Candidatus Limnocylindrales bacterium]